MRFSRRRDRRSCTGTRPINWPFNALAITFSAPNVQMSYATPHHAHEFMKAAALAVVHQFALACQRKQTAEKKALLLKKREIDFNARLGMFFGPEASISAQGVKDSDLRIKAPVLEVELKYCRPNEAETQPVNHWRQVIEKDWRWLLALTASGEVFKKSGWVVFFPSVDLFTLHQCFQIPNNRTVNGQLAPRDYAPFTQMVMPMAGHPSRLQYRPAAWERDVLLRRAAVGSPIRVRRQMIGNREQPIWGVIFSRVGTLAYQQLQHLPSYDF